MASEFVWLLMYWTCCAVAGFLFGYGLGKRRIYRQEAHPDAE